MKKMVMAAMLAVSATSAFAQDALVKEAKKQFRGDNVEAALQTLTPALTSSETADKAEAWNLMNDIQFKIYQTEMDKLRASQPGDTVKMYKALVEAFKAAEECDKYDQQPNEKGKVKIRFRKANAARYLMDRSQIFNAGIIMYQRNDLKGAVAAWGTYIESAKSSVFEGIDLGQDDHLADATYNAALLSAQAKDYANAEKYAKMAAQIPGKEDQANEILLFTKKEAAQTHEDSVAYLNLLKQFHAEQPENQKYLNMLIDYFAHRDNAEMKAWAEEELKTNTGNKTIWFMHGYTLMQEEKWDEAVEDFKKALEIDGSYVQACFNAGVCLNSKAIQMKNDLADKKTGGLTNENAEKVKVVLRDALVYMEKSRELDPEQETVKWRYPIYQIYYNLGDQEKAAEFE